MSRRAAGRHYEVSESVAIRRRKSQLNLTDGVFRTRMRAVAGAELVGVRAAPATAAPGDTVMTKDQKIIRAKAGLLELAKQLGNVSQACKIMGTAGQLLPVQGSL